MKKNEYELPSIEQARKRDKNRAAIERELFEIPDECRNIGYGRKYYLRTYGCQANQRDSETIAGILDELAYTASDDINEADLNLSEKTLISLSLLVVVWLKKRA